LIILVDGNYVCHYHMHRLRGFSYNGKATGIIFGFLRELLSLAKRFDCTRFVFAWDSRKSVRKLHFPDYKLKRRKDKTPEELEEERKAFEQFTKLRKKVLPKFGFRNIFMRAGYEADDVIASICQANEDEEVVIVSVDNDLYQLLSDKHHLFNIRNKKFYRAKDFVEEWGIEPEAWAKVKSIAGCPGDGVPGVPGVGNKKARDYLLGKLPRTGKVYKKIESNDGQKIIFRNKLLVTLPMPGVGSFDLVENEVFYLKDFLDICDEYGFRSLLAQEQVWREVFGMEVRR